MIAPKLAPAIKVPAATIGIGSPDLASRPATTAQTLACEPTEMSICRPRITRVMPTAATRTDAFRTVKSASGPARKNRGAKIASIRKQDSR